MVKNIRVKIGDFRDRGGGEIHNWIFGGEYLDECTMPLIGDENCLGNVNYPPIYSCLVCGIKR